MSDIKISIIDNSEDLPHIKSDDFFNSPEMFRIVEQTPGQAPYMAIAISNDEIIGHLLLILRRRGALIPPYLFTQARAYGCGEYAPDIDREEVFSLMLNSLERKIRKKLYLYIEFSDLETKMFGYAKFRSLGFFPVHWMKIRNSLHSNKMEEWLQPRAIKHLNNAAKANLITTITQSPQDVSKLMKILKGSTSLKIRRYIPDLHMFNKLQETGHCNIFVTRDEDEIIGGCICLYSKGNCYLWYLTAQNKLHIKRTYAITLWTAMQHAHSIGCRHLCFMDVGLPFKRNPMREFILSFGGKPIGTYRWFRCSIGWINSFLSWFWRE